MPDPRSPWRVRRIPLEGSEVAEWFRLRGWVETDSGAAHAFIDEAIVADIAIRRVWHTALTLSRPASPEQHADTLIVHVAGEGTVQIGDAESTALTPDDVLFVPRGVAVTYRSNEPIARIEIDHGARERAGEVFHVQGELVSAVMITSASRPLHAMIAGGGGGGGGGG
ncbi:cupin domain-containing protein, partial [Microbacterium sp. B19]|uniref:cupin domain-containing protein n=1 Tax=Microbacterium sp. B19 TaxID=96765 RepID=UPI0005660CFE